MPISVVLDFEDATLDQYDRTIELIGLRPGGTAAPGVLFHWVAEKGDGIRIVETWAEKSDFERYAEEVLLPAAKEAGLGDQPTLAFIPVHNHLTGS